jgi:probable F420-dependent oxidoreductase
VLCRARRYHLTVDFGLVLPTMPDGASREGIEAAAETAARLGWHSVWTTDHLLVPRSAAREYGLIYEAVSTLAYVGGRHADLKLGTSVIVVPMRNAIVLAKELATIDNLAGGRLIAGVGVGWNEPEYANVGEKERFHKRGAYLDETIRLWRHLWSGSREPFTGRFHEFSDFAFGPLPEQRDKLPIWVGGRSDAALRRAGALADGYHSSMSSPSQFAVRVPVVRQAAQDAGRPSPALSARVRVKFGPVSGAGTSYVMAGAPEQMVPEVDAFAECGVTLMALAFGETDPDKLVPIIERFDRDVAAVIRARPEGAGREATPTGVPV